LLHSCRYSFIFVLMYCFRFRSMSRKRLFLFESVVGSVRTKTPLKPFEIIVFDLWKTSLVSKI
jgi:hypothetical protein